jgi:DnaJ-class molecular chaperone
MAGTLTLDLDLAGPAVVERDGFAGSAVAERDRFADPAVAERDRSADRSAHDAPAGPLARELTLDDLVSGAWEELTATRTASCPACGGRVTPRFGAGAGPVAGTCRDCGTALA